VELIDTHTHLDSFARRGELPAILARAKEAGLAGMVAIGTDTDDWPLYRDLARAHPQVIFYSAGLHPCSVKEDWARRVAELAGYWNGARTTDVAKVETARAAVPPYRAFHPVALGEIGLDRFHLPKDDAVAAERIFSWQKAAFAEQLKLAKQLECPVVIHSRGAFRESVAMIDGSGVNWLRVVFHCFSEGPAEMAELMERGGCGSFTGVITYKNAESVRAAARAQGLARLMIETDAPYLSPVPHRGKPNEPAYLRHTAEFCAELFGTSHGELAEVTTANAKAFFGI
jgi:TatD DNase family protein